MTDQHPLTDEICRAIDDKAMIDEDDWKGCMKAGADWQLEQVVEWLKNVDMDHSLSYDGEYRSDRFLVINAFREAMRPTQEDN